MTSPYRLALLTEPPTWQGRRLNGRSLDLLAVLAGSQDARVSDAALIEALWPDDAPARPLRALHVVVSRLRAVVGEGVVERSGDGYRLELAEDAAVLLPLYIASQLYKEEDLGLATLYRNEFELGLDRLTAPPPGVAGDRFVSTSGWCG